MKIKTDTLSQVLKLEKDFVLQNLVEYIDYLKSENKTKIETTKLTMKALDQLIERYNIGSTEMVLSVENAIDKAYQRKQKGFDTLIMQRLGIDDGVKSKLDKKFNKCFSAVFSPGFEELR